MSVLMSGSAELVSKTELAVALACEGSPGCSPPSAACKAPSCTALHRSGPGGATERPCCTCRDLDATSQERSLEDPEPDTPLCVCITGEGLTKFFGGADAGLCKDPAPSFGRARTHLPRMGGARRCATHALYDCLHCDRSVRAHASYLLTSTHRIRFS